MACEIVKSGRVMFVLWGTPERKDFDSIISEARLLHCARGPFVFVARVPAGAQAPSDALKGDVSRCIGFLLEHCASYHGVIEGNGFTMSAKRAVLATLFLMTRHRGKLHVHPSVNQVADSAPSEMRDDVVAAFKQFEPSGVLGRNLDSIAPPRPAFASSRR